MDTNLLDHMVDIANTQLMDGYFQKEMLSRLPAHCTYTDHTKARIAEELFFKASRGIRIIRYKTTNPWSKSMGYYSPATGNIYINTRKKWTLDKVAGFVMHEYCHVRGYGHGGNCISWYCGGRRKMKSVPYAMGRIAREVMKDRMNINS